MRPEHWLYTIPLRLRSLFRWAQVDRELDDELRDHLERKTEGYMAQGMTQEEAHRRARIDMDGIEAAKEKCRDTRRVNWIEDLIQDLRYGLRMLRKSPGFTAAAVLTLTLGIGANAAIADLISAMLFRPPSGVRNADRLVRVFENRKNSCAYCALSYYEYLYYRDHSGSFSGLASDYPTSPLNMVTADDSREVIGAVVSANYFDLLGLRPYLGRFFLPSEDLVPGRDPVAVLGYRLWQTQFGGNSAIIGKTVKLNGTVFTIVGIAPRDFRGAWVGGADEVWIPSMMSAIGYRYCDTFSRDCTYLQAIGSLKPGRTIEEAQAELSSLSAQLAITYPATNKDIGASIASIIGVFPSSKAQVARFTYLLFGGVSLLLLIACANLAGLLLARNAARQQEITVRLAIGAGRSRLFRQLLTECLSLSLLGGLAALIVVYWSKNLITPFFVDNEGYRSYFDLKIDWTIILYTGLVSVVVGVVFGLVPILRSARIDLAQAIKSADPAQGRHAAWTRSGLLVGQIALSISLLVGALLVSRSLANIRHGPGFDPQHVALLRLMPSSIAYDAETAERLQHEIIRRVEAVPSVQSVSLSGGFPVGLWGGRLQLHLPKANSAAETLQVAKDVVTPHYFDTLHIPLIQGRDFSEFERKGSAAVVIINQTLARRLWPEGDPLGKAVIVDGTIAQVIGVTADAKYRNITEGPIPFAYLPFWHGNDLDARMCVRVAGDAGAALHAIHRAIRSVDANVPLSEEMTLEEEVEYEFGDVRMAQAILGFSGTLAVLLAAIGIYGLLAFNVVRRTREIGIRVSLGAQPSRLVAMVIRQGMRITCIGLCIGVIGALLTSRALAYLLFGVRPTDLVTFIAAALLFAAISLLACYLPARRAASVDPLIALRYE